MFSFFTEASYKIISPNKLSASFDESLAVKFASHPRYRRQADSTASTIPVTPDHPSPAQTTALPGKFVDLVSKDISAHIAY